MSTPTETTRIQSISTLGEGTQLNGLFEIDEKIASGGMGEVFRGHEIMSGHPIAIKVVLPELARDQTVIELFNKEAGTLRDLSHPAIVRYITFGTDPIIGRPYLVMEFINGLSLVDRLEQGPVSLDDARQLFKRLASGLKAAHRHGVIHRDVSCDNVILVNGNVRDPKIIDFGIARSAKSVTLLQGKFAGKYNFVSPEQLGLFNGEITEASDVYSLGLLMVNVLRGTPLDMNGTPVEVIEKRRTVPDLSEIDETIRPLIALMLQPDPKDRKLSMGDIAEWCRSGRMGAGTAAAALAATDAMNAPKPVRGTDVAKATAALVAAEAAAEEDDETEAASGDAKEREEDHSETAALEDEFDDAWAEAQPAADAAPVEAIPTTSPPAPSRPPEAMPEDPAPTPAPERSLPPRQVSAAPRQETQIAGSAWQAPETEKPAEEATPAADPTVPPDSQAGADGDPFGIFRPAPEAVAAYKAAVDSGTANGATAQPARPRRRSLAPLALAIVVLAAAGTGGLWYGGIGPFAGASPELVPAVETPQGRDTESQASRSTPEQGSDTPQTPRPSTLGEGTSSLSVPRPSVPEADTPRADPAIQLTDLGSRLAWVKDFRGGPCFFARGTQTDATSLRVEGIGTNVDAFRRLETAFQTRFGLEPQIDVRPIVERQCAVADFLSGLSGAQNDEVRMTLGSDRIRSGELLSGRVSGLTKANALLYLIDNDGYVYQVDQHLKRSGDSGTFSFRLVELSSREPLPQMLLLLSSDRPIRGGAFENAAVADVLLPRLLEAIRKEPVGLAYAYAFFTLGGT